MKSPFMRLFNRGYIVFLIFMALAYFTLPNNLIYPAIVTLPLLFGVYQVIIYLMLRKKQEI
ncbi:hypothetical protein [Bacillus sp. B-jedd]|uniref:hypothetical protein n=1 Tax=Bacillus sp. B-jedd TaxID=1476857 RepID=UPI0005156267|nr:hypothetical protein [Bacillus sp. B-jedd]CEG27071.1 hypothetical protein BN1002_01927 [Bacillus sp. B-jedd]